MKVKICGITDVETALNAADYGADALGFVFADSRRKVSPQLAREIIAQLPLEINKVGVFVNESKQKIEDIAEYCGLTHIQLHGEETPDFCNGFSLPVIKAFNIGCHADLELVTHYECEGYLLDSPKGVYRGGTGIPFDWSILQNGMLDRKKLILAGGLNSDNVASAIRTANPNMVDVSSGVETEGKKDLSKMKEFILAAKRYGGKE
ncbi:phosphoribosylanthranilate isomerase [Neobacillus piezotolerans]|uniref:N-(5'-phosphoribosyl)anthranilate isomerase n=1 Tax=Neobacillus piezotolerans TaxID=2259171 RepID=A0A3D8GQM0_9BACI|nr:phosphoribosylanthranilate isomerase [Neobacillus piezotolerans]RDU36479.1 phosphoribosylanthranilate isomerase [Neobacillus piezotolerans]